MSRAHRLSTHRRGGDDASGTRAFAAHGALAWRSRLVITQLNRRRRHFIIAGTSARARRASRELLWRVNLAATCVRGLRLNRGHA